MYSKKYYFYTKTKILGAGRLLLRPLQAVFFLILVQEYFDLFSDSLVSRIPQGQSHSQELVPLQEKQKHFNR